MVIPLVDLKAQYLSLKSEIDATIGHVLFRTSYIDGEQVYLLEKEIANRYSVKECVGVSSVTEALRLALAACEIGSGDDVITFPFAFAGVAEAICMAGSIPVYPELLRCAGAGNSSML